MLGPGLAADQMVDAGIRHIKSDKSDDYSHTGNSWDQDALDYAYHKYDPNLYPNPYEKKKE